MYPKQMNAFNTIEAFELISIVNCFNLTVKKIFGKYFQKYLN